MSVLSIIKNISGYVLPTNEHTILNANNAMQYNTTDKNYGNEQRNLEYEWKRDGRHHTKCIAVYTTVLRLKRTKYRNKRKKKCMNNLSIKNYKYE